MGYLAHEISIFNNYLNFETGSEIYIFEKTEFWFSLDHDGILEQKAHFLQREKYEGTNSKNEF